MCVWVVVVTERGRGIVRSSALCVHLCVCVFVCGGGGVGGWEIGGSLLQMLSSAA